MTKPLSATQTQILKDAAARPDRLAQVPPALPAAARRAVSASLLRAGWVEEVPSDNGQGEAALRITEAGLAAIGVTLPDALPASAADATPAIPLREAARRLLSAWEAAGEGQAGVPLAGVLGSPMAALRQALERRGEGRAPRARGAVREGTKRQAVLALLRRVQGATLAQVMEATGWAPHTVRGFLAGLKRQSQPVEVLERVRQVGPGNQGAKGSYSVYRIGGEEG